MHLVFGMPFLSQDFMQVVSMFAGFDFHWPPQVKALFHALSVVNFNLDLVAPECSVSLTFETKWCACLPLSSSH